MLPAFLLLSIGGVTAASVNGNIDIRSIYIPRINASSSELEHYWKWELGEPAQHIKWAKPNINLNASSVLMLLYLIIVIYIVKLLVYMILLLFILTWQILQ